MLKYQVGLVAAILAILVFIYFNSQFAVFQQSEKPKIIAFDVKAGNGVVYNFDNYKFEVWTSKAAYSPANCEDNSNWNYFCDYRIDYVDENGCPRYSAGQEFYQCPSGCQWRGQNRYPTYEGNNKCYCGNNRYKSPTVICDNSNRRTGGGLDYSKQEGCFWKANVLYKGELIKEIQGPYKDGWTKGTEKIYLTQDGKIGTIDNHFFRLYFGSTYTQDGKCRGIDGFAELNIDPTAINYTVELPENVIYTGETNKLKVIVEQNIETFYGILIVNYQIPTAVGTATKFVNQSINISKGINEYYIDIPTIKVTDEMLIQPEVVFLYDIRDWDGVNYYDRENTPKGDYYPIGSILGEWVTLEIRPVAEKDIEALQEVVENSQETLAELQEELDAMAQLIKLKEENIQNQVEAIEVMELKIEEKSYLLLQAQNNLEDTVKTIDEFQILQEEKLEYFASLLTILDEDKNSFDELNQILISIGLNNEEIVQVMDLYKGKMIEQQQLSSKLDIDNDELNAIIAKYKDNLISDQQAIELLGVSNEELQVLVQEYEERLDNVANSVSGLKSDKEEMQQILNNLKGDQYYKKQLAEGLDEYESKLVVQTIIIVFLIFFIVSLIIRLRKDKR